MKKPAKQLHPGCKKALASIERIIILQKDQINELLELINFNQKMINSLAKIVKHNEQALAKLIAN